jgi:hypothetical protein
MDHLHHRGDAGEPGRGWSEHLAAQQNQDGTQPLAPAGLKILPYGGKGLHRSDGFQANFTLYLIQIRADQVEDLNGGELLPDVSKCHKDV